MWRNTTTNDHLLICSCIYTCSILYTSYLDALFSLIKRHLHTVRFVFLTAVLINEDLSLLECSVRQLYTETNISESFAASILRVLLFVLEAEHLLMF
jgi:hypothetical protein